MEKNEKEIFGKTLPVYKPLEDFNLSPFFGAGFISLIKYLEDSKQPFKGRVELQYGSIAADDYLPVRQPFSLSLLSEEVCANFTVGFFLTEFQADIYFIADIHNDGLLSNQGFVFIV